MVGADFGQPRLLNAPSSPDSSSIAHSSPIYQTLQAPSFADFSFKSIGQPPRLLNRFSEATAAQDSADDDAMSTSSDSDQRLQNIEQSVARTRPSLWQALTDQDNALSANHDDSTTQAPIFTSTRSPVMESSIHNDNTSVPLNGKFPHTDTFVSSSPFLSSSAHPPSGVQHSMSTTSPASEEHASKRNNSRSSDSSRLSYASASSGSSGGTDHAMEDIRRSLPHTSRKYEGLRQFQSRLQAFLQRHDQPNLASAMVLTKTAQQKSTVVHEEARRLHNLTKEILSVAQQGHATATALLKDAEEAKGLADGAKSELERLSDEQSGQNEINELLHSLGDWIMGQEAEEAAMRERRAQLRLKKQGAGLVVKATQPAATSPSSGISQMQSAPFAVPPESAPVSPPQRQPLFYSPTPEVVVKIDPHSLPQPHLHTSPPATMVPDPSQRQAELRRILKDKHRSPEESQAPSPVETDQLQEYRPEEERKRTLEESKKRRLDQERTEEYRMSEEEQREREEMEQRQRQGAERAHEEKRAREQEEKKLAHSLEIMRKARADADRKAAEEDALREEAQKRAQQEEARKIVQQEEETRKKALARMKEEEAKKKAQQEEEARRRAQQEEARRKAQQEEEARRKAEVQRKLGLLRQQQEEDLQAKLAEEAEQRRAKEKVAEEEQTRIQEESPKARQEKLLEEQNKRRQQIQLEKDKSRADRAQQILAQRGQLPQLSSGAANKMSPNSSQIVSSAAVSKPIDPSATPHSAEPVTPTVPLAAQAPLAINKPPLTHRIPPKQHVNGFNSNDSLSGLNKSSSSDPGTTTNGHTLTAPASKRRSPSTRQPSLPPIVSLSQPAQSSSPATSQPVPSPRRASLSVYRQSADGGNIPYRQNLNLSPQAQVANIRHVVSALNLPSYHLSMVKAEPLDESVLLYPQSSEDVPSTQKAAQTVQGPQRRSSSTQLTPVVTTSLPGHPLSLQPSHGSHTYTILEHDIPSSSTVTDLSASVHALPQQPQQIAGLEESALNQIQAPAQVLSVREPEPQLGRRPSNEPLNQPSQVQQPTPPPPQGDPESRSQSPFRMGPDTLVPMPSTDPLTDTGEDVSQSHHPAPSYNRGRIETTRQWDHYSPSPRPRSPFRQTDTYRPNYPERQTGRKRSRGNTPPPGPPVIRDYRDYDDRRGAPRRRTHSPPLPPPSRRPLRRTPSRSPPPSIHQNRPPLVSRLELGNTNDSYRPATPPRDWEREPKLLGRFTDSAPSHPHPPATRGGRGRGKRGRGGGVPPPGHSQTSLEQRISSAATLMTRLEDPRRP